MAGVYAGAYFSTGRRRETAFDKRSAIKQSPLARCRGFSLSISSDHPLNLSPGTAPPGQFFCAAERIVASVADGVIRLPS